MAKVSKGLGPKDNDKDGSYARAEEKRLKGLKPARKGGTPSAGYTKLKNPAAEAKRREFVKAELAKKNITPSASGKRSVAEIAARELARQKFARQRKRQRSARKSSSDYGMGME